MNKLNLGSGKDYREDWINVDITGKANITHDLNQFPYPFPDNYADEILMSHILEHLDDPFEVLKEVMRISKEGAKITIKVPHFSYLGAYRNPAHKHVFSLDSIDELYCGFTIVQKKLIVSNNKFVNLVGQLFIIYPLFYERFLYGYFPVNEIRWIIKK